MDGSSSKNSNLNRQMRKQRDASSHFILRAAYCRTEELRRWFLTQETFLFKHQLDKIADASTGGHLLRQFLNDNDLNFEIVPEEEKIKVESFLMQIPVFKASTGGDNSSAIKVVVPSVAEVKNTTYFKIHFSEASDLIAKRQCYVSKGYAYVPLPKIVSIVTARFRMNLSKSLTKASRVFGAVISDDAPIAPLLNTMNSQYTGKDYDGKRNNLSGDYELNAENIDSYASSMPLCMSQLHNGLKQDSKLRHHGRLQYGLFLKGAGMTMEESLIFFQKHFTRLISSEKFQKEYTYNIRHMYGKEGKRTSYSAYNCKKIVLGDGPNAGDHHGCPYKHYDHDHLSSLLNKMQVGTVADRDSMMRFKQQGQYHAACQTHFKVMHPSPGALDVNGVGEHPNAWYAASVAYNQMKTGKSSSSDMVVKTEVEIK